MTPLGRLAHELRLAAVALQFLSRIPVPAAVGFHPDWLHRCVRHFPLAGALIGAAGAAVLALAHALWPPLAAATLAVAFSVWLTAAFHEDGLADTFDALLGAARREHHRRAVQAHAGGQSHARRPGVPVEPPPAPLQPG